MTTKLLYYGSLEKHMDSYMDQVKQTELNEQFQLAQNKIVREGELMNLSQADVMNKLKQLQQDLQNQVAQSIIVPLSKTNAPEMIKQEEKYNPMTSSDYENALRKPTTFAQELLKNQGKGKKGNKIELQDILSKKDNLKKSVKNESKKATKTPFQQELEAKINIRNKGMVEHSTSTSTQATTDSTSSNASSPKSSFNLHPAQSTARLKAEFKAKGKPWPYGKGNVSYANMIKAREQLGQGLKKK